MSLPEGGRYARLHLRCATSTAAASVSSVAGNGALGKSYHATLVELAFAALAPPSDASKTVG